MQSEQSSVKAGPGGGSRPLLHGQPLTDHEHMPLAKMPLPKIQFAILCILRLLGPLSFTQIFPYINRFINELRVTEDPSQVGFYSGLVVSDQHLFSEFTERPCY